MLQEALQQAGATQYERTDARKAHRNGYKDRSLKTRSSGSFPFEMQVFGRYARVEKAQVNAIVKSCHQGFSTRRIQEIVSPPGINQVSSVSVSRIASDLDGQGAGIPPAADRTGYPVPLCGCFILQGVRWRTLRHQGGPGG